VFLQSSVFVCFCLFLGLPNLDPDPIVRYMDPDPSIIKQKK
jgi:hypothetical protein